MSLNGNGGIKSSLKACRERAANPPAKRAALINRIPIRLGKLGVFVTLSSSYHETFEIPIVLDQKFEPD